MTKKTSKSQKVLAALSASQNLQQAEISPISLNVSAMISFCVWKDIRSTSISAPAFLKVRNRSTSIVWEFLNARSLLHIK